MDDNGDEYVHKGDTFNNCGEGEGVVGIYHIHSVRDVD